MRLHHDVTLQLQIVEEEEEVKSCFDVSRLVSQFGGFVLSALGVRF